MIEKMGTGVDPIQFAVGQRVVSYIILVLGQSPSHIIYDVTIPEEQHPTRDTLFENMEMMKLRMTLINQINKDVTTHI